MTASKTYRVRFQEITCYGLDVISTSRIDAIDAAEDEFFRLSLADRADAIIADTTLDCFEAEESDVD